MKTVNKTAFILVSLLYFVVSASVVLGDAGRGCSRDHRCDPSKQFCCK
jgi:hypothetical protein